MSFIPRRDFPFSDLDSYLPFSRSDQKKRSARNVFLKVPEERTRRRHRAVRGFCDRYGFPLGRHIRSNWAEDPVYLRIKPLMWCFCRYWISRIPGRRTALPCRMPESPGRISRFGPESLYSHSGYKVLTAVSDTHPGFQSGRGRRAADWEVEGKIAV